MAGDLSFEIAKAVPLHPCVEIDLGRHDRSPFLRPGQRAAIVIVDGREHPVSRDVSSPSTAFPLISTLVPKLQLWNQAVRDRVFGTTQSA